MRTSVYYERAFDEHEDYIGHGSKDRIPTFTRMFLSELLSMCRVRVYLHTY